MTHYNRLSFEERKNISNALDLGFSISFIARQLKRSKSTISREVAKGSVDGRYLAIYSEDRFLAGLSRNKKLFANEDLRSFVIDKLVNCRWSPAAIAGRLKLFSNPGLKASYETIYKFVYDQEGLAMNLPHYLRRKKKVRGPTRHKSKRNTIIGLQSISTRPECINDRSEYGHFEADLLILSLSKGTNLITMVERKSRVSKIIRNRNKSSSPVIGKIDAHLKTLGNLFKSMTFDRGKEFAKHHILSGDTFFCNPHSPWQKGAVENLNGRIRALLPKNSSVRPISQEYIDWVENIINNTPLKVLGYLTPLESLASRNGVALDV